MGKMRIILILVLLTSVVSAASSIVTDADRRTLLRDGFVLRGVDGELVGPDSNDAWFFEFDADVNDYKAFVKAGTRLKLLPSSGLEKMIADVKIRPEATYRLWNGRVTRYKGRNYIFPTYFLPLRKAEKLRAQPSQEPQQEQLWPTETPSEQQRESTVTEPNDAMGIPPEIMEKLKARRQEIAGTGQRIVDSHAVTIDELALTTEEGEVPSAKHYTLSTDWILADRTALLVKQDDGGFTLLLDAIGRNVPQVSLRLLPCETLDLTELRQSAVPELLRFKIAGIMTKYKGEHYLLLQRAIRAYSHGNFGR